MREPGYYWCKDKGQWGVAEWYVSHNISMWFICGDEQLRKDSDFEEIDERRIERKPKQTYIEKADEEYKNDLSEALDKQKGI